MTDRDWYTGFMNRTCQEFRDHFLEDWQKALMSVMEGISPESLFGNSEIWKMLGHPGSDRGFPMPPDDAAYRMLGLDKTASDEEVKRRYRELAKRLHPDVAGKETEHFFKLVQAAYEQIARERGW